MRYIAVAVPAGLPSPALSVHIGDATSIDQLGIERCVAAHAVLHNDLCTLVDRLDGLSLLARDELIDVVHPVFALEEVLAEDIIVGDVAVVARGVACVCTVHPRRIVRRHNVAVDTG